MVSGQSLLMSTFDVKLRLVLVHRMVRASKRSWKYPFTCKYQTRDNMYVLEEMEEEKREGREGGVSPPREEKVRRPKMDIWK